MAADHGEPDGRAASAVTAPNATTAMTIGATHHRRRATRPRPAPASIATATIPASSAGLSAVPSDPMAARTTEPGASATTRSATASTSDGAPVNRCGVSTVATATPAATAPATADRARETNSVDAGVFIVRWGTVSDPSVSAFARRDARARIGRPRRRA